MLQTICDAYETALLFRSLQYLTLNCFTLFQDGGGLNLKQCTGSWRYDTTFDSL
jgi:hypothetical protein